MNTETDKIIKFVRHLKSLGENAKKKNVGFGYRRDQAKTPENDSGIFICDPQNPETYSRMIFRLLMLPFALTGLLFLLTGCEDPPPEEEPVETTEWDEWSEEDEWSDDGDYSSGNQADGEEVIEDTYYEVIDRRQAGGELYDDPDKKNMDGRPVRRRQPMEYMIVVRGNNTHQEQGYLLPSSDYSQVRVGNRLRKSTLSRWETTSTNHIPPQTEPSDDDEDTGIGRVRDDRSPFDPTYEPF